MVKELSTLAKARPSTLDEKRRIERELGLVVEPAMVMPRTSRRAPRRGGWKRVAEWLTGASK